MQPPYEPINPPFSDVVEPVVSIPRKKQRIPKKLQHIPPLKFENVFTRLKLTVPPTRRRKSKKAGPSNSQDAFSEAVPEILRASLSEGAVGTSTRPSSSQLSLAVNSGQGAPGYFPPPSPVSGHVYIDNTVGIAQDAEHVYSPRDICYLFPHLQGQATFMGSAQAHGDHCTTQTCPDIYAHSLYLEENSPSTASSVYGDEQLSYSPSDAVYSPPLYGQGYPPSMGTSPSTGFQQVDQFPNIVSTDPIYPLTGIRGVEQFCYDDLAYSSYPSNEEPCPQAMPMVPSVPRYSLCEETQFPTTG